MTESTMDALHFPATKATPEVAFTPASGLLTISGESYPENAAAFYAPIYQAVQKHLEETNSPLQVRLSFTYFNSSSSKALMNLFDLLESTAQQDRDISVEWLYHPENETVYECGEEFMEDLENLTFTLTPCDCDRRSS